VPHRVRPGGLSEADRAEIIRLTEERGYKANRIARAIEKHPATVHWFMVSQGLAACGNGGRRCRRNGRQALPFEADEDAFIVALRLDGLQPAAIAQRATERFGHLRSRHTIYNRLVRVAAREDAGCAP
jgi:hypothetical protein